MYLHIFYQIIEMAVFALQKYGWRDPPPAAPQPALPQLPVLPQMLGDNTTGADPPLATVKVKTEPGTSTPAELESIPPKRTKLANVDWFDDIITIDDNDDDNDFDEKIMKEVSRYVAEPAIMCDPLVWWRDHSGIYPMIARLAKRVLCIPATSTPSERIFSLAGNIVSNKRSQLSHSSIDHLIFLNTNFELTKWIPWYSLCLGRNLR